MYSRTRLIMLALLALAFFAIVFGRAQAGGKHFFPPVTEPLVMEECGSCHMAFAPSMLPASSWQRMMGNLKNHFGDDATVAPDLAAKIATYLAANAADTGGRRYSGKLLAASSATDAPLRITELPKWVSAHRSVPDWEWKHKDVRTKANCAACHTDAQLGYYTE